MTKVKILKEFVNGIVTRDKNNWIELVDVIDQESDGKTNILDKVIE